MGRVGQRAGGREGEGGLGAGCGVVWCGVSRAAESIRYQGMAWRWICLLYFLYHTSQKRPRLGSQLAGCRYVNEQIANSLLEVFCCTDRSGWWQPTTEPSDWRGYSALATTASSGQDCPSGRGSNVCVKWQRRSAQWLCRGQNVAAGQPARDVVSPAKRSPWPHPILTPPTLPSDSDDTTMMPLREGCRR